jgi:hypothetical protein
MPFGVLNAVQAGVSAIPLFFGENNIFSGKARRASKELEKTFRRSQDMGLPGEYTEAMQNIRSQANVGIPSAALGLYKQQASRAQASQLGALGSRRSALAGIGSIAQAGQDAALNLASMQSQAMQAGQQRLNQSLMQMGGIKQQDELRKLQESREYWGTRRAEANQAVSSALSGVGSALGTSLMGDMYAGEAQKPIGLFKGKIGSQVKAINSVANKMKSGTFRLR